MVVDFNHEKNIIITCRYTTYNNHIEWLKNLHVVMENYRRK